MVKSKPLELPGVVLLGAGEGKAGAPLLKEGQKMNRNEAQLFMKGHVKLCFDGRYVEKCRFVREIGT